MIWSGATKIVACSFALTPVGGFVIDLFMSVVSNGGGCVFGR